MKKRTFILLVLLLISVCAFAQAPAWQWASHAGGNDYDVGKAITVDDAGNSYVTGGFVGTATFGSYPLTSSGEYDIFVAKMDSNGNWQWATQAGGSDWDKGLGITIDDAGNSYVTGGFVGTATFGSYPLTSSGEYDIFVAKMDSNGNWQWATRAGGYDYVIGLGIIIDDAGNSYVTGYFREIATFGSYILTSNGWSDIFVAKLDANGNWLWATKAGGSNGDQGYGITIDDAGNSFVTGYFQGIATFGSYSITTSGFYDIFVAKMDANGNWQWATQAGGSEIDIGYGITIDDAGNSYVTGYFEETATFGSYSLTSSGSWDIVVAKMNADGNWEWATKAGGTSTDCGYGITVDDAGNSYVTGKFRSTATFGSYYLTSGGSLNIDIFAAMIDTDGNWQWAIQACGSGWDEGHGITIDNAGNSYVTGHFSGTATFGSYSLNCSGEWDIFVAKLNSSVFVENEIIPSINILSNYPNPFKPSTTISFTTEQAESTETCPPWRIEIYNIKGQKIKTLAVTLSGVEGSATWDGTDDSNKPVSSGIYFYKLKTDNLEKMRKMILIK